MLMPDIKEPALSCTEIFEESFVATGQQGNPTIPWQRMNVLHFVRKLKNISLNIMRRKLSASTIYQSIYYTQKYCNLSNSLQVDTIQII